MCVQTSVFLYRSFILYLVFNTDVWDTSSDLIILILSIYLLIYFLDVSKIQNLKQTLGKMAKECVNPACFRKLDQRE